MAHNTMGGLEMEINAKNERMWFWDLKFVENFSKKFLSRFRTFNVHLFHFIFHQLTLNPYWIVFYILFNISKLIMILTEKSNKITTFLKFTSTFWVMKVSSQLSSISQHYYPLDSHLLPSLINSFLHRYLNAIMPTQQPSPCV